MRTFSTPNNAKNGWIKQEGKTLQLLGIAWEVTLLSKHVLCRHHRACRVSGFDGCTCAILRLSCIIPPVCGLPQKVQSNVWTSIAGFGKSPSVICLRNLLTMVSVQPISSIPLLSEDDLEQAWHAGLLSECVISPDYLHNQRWTQDLPNLGVVRSRYSDSFTLHSACGMNQASRGSTASLYHYQALPGRLNWALCTLQAPSSLQSWRFWRLHIRNTPSLMYHPTSVRSSVECTEQRLGFGWVWEVTVGHLSPQPANYCLSTTSFLHSSILRRWLRTGLTCWPSIRMCHIPGLPTLWWD